MIRLGKSALQQGKDLPAKDPDPAQIQGTGWGTIFELQAK